MAHNLFQAQADELPEESWTAFDRFKDSEPKRRHQTNVRRREVEDKGFQELVLEAEHLAEWDHKPYRAHGTYRMIALRKTIKVLKGQARRLVFRLLRVNQWTDILINAPPRCRSTD